MFCPRCGNELREGAQFCNNCGASLGFKEEKPKKHKLMKYWFLALVVLLIMAVNELGGYRYDYIDHTGEVVTSSNYEASQNFSEGFAAVQKNDRWGYTDKQGNEVVACKYDYAEGFSDGMAIVKKNSKYGYIDKQGNEEISCK